MGGDSKLVYRDHKVNGEVLGFVVDSLPNGHILAVVTNQEGHHKGVKEFTTEQNARDWITKKYQQLYPSEEDE